MTIGQDIQPPDFPVKGLCRICRREIPVWATSKGDPSICRACEMHEGIRKMTEAGDTIPSLYSTTYEEQMDILEKRLSRLEQIVYRICDVEGIKR